MDLTEASGVFLLDVYGKDRDQIFDAIVLICFHQLGSECYNHGRMIELGRGAV